MKKINTPYGQIVRTDSGREFFAGSTAQLNAARNFEYFSNPDNADGNSLAHEAALAAEAEEDEFPSALGHGERR